MLDDRRHTRCGDDAEESPVLAVLATVYLVLVLPFVVLVGKGIAHGARTDDDLGTALPMPMPMPSDTPGAAALRQVA